MCSTNKYARQSEENIRQLFADAEQQDKGDASSLHIPFDEIDAVCHQLGAASSSTGMDDTAVNQLMSMVCTVCEWKPLQMRWKIRWPSCAVAMGKDMAEKLYDK